MTTLQDRARQYADRIERTHEFRSGSEIERQADKNMAALLREMAQKLDEMEAKAHDNPDHGPRRGGYCADAL